MSSSQPKFNFVIGYLRGDGLLCVYSYGSELQFGNLRMAKGMLDYIKRTDPYKDWKLYKLNPEEIK